MMVVRCIEWAAQKPYWPLAQNLGNAFGEGNTPILEKRLMRRFDNSTTDRSDMRPAGIGPYEERGIAKGKDRAVVKGQINLALSARPLERFSNLLAGRYEAPLLDTGVGQSRADCTESVKPVMPADPWNRRTIHRLFQCDQVTVANDADALHLPKASSMASSHMVSLLSECLGSAARCLAGGWAAKKWRMTMSTPCAVTDRRLAA